MFSSSRPSSAGPAGPSSAKRRRIDTLEPDTAHERHQRFYALRRSYERGRPPPKPASRDELDVLKERHQFVRDSNVASSDLSWEDQLAHKYYQTLFREYALVNLKHYKSGAIALRWRTEPEVLSGIGHLTCGSLRCRYHEPSPALLAALEDAPADPQDETPLVEARLEELEVPFGYVEGGQRKSVLVKCVLCRECAKKLRHGRRKAKEDREQSTVVTQTSRGEDLDRRSAAMARESSRDWSSARRPDEQSRRESEPERSEHRHAESRSDPDHRRRRERSRER